MSAPKKRAARDAYPVSDAAALLADRKYDPAYSWLEIRKSLLADLVERIRTLEQAEVKP